MSIDIVVKVDSRFGKDSNEDNIEYTKEKADKAGDDIDCFHFNHLFNILAVVSTLLCCPSASNLGIPNAPIRQSSQLDMLHRPSMQTAISPGRIGLNVKHFFTLYGKLFLHCPVMMCTDVHYYRVTLSCI